MRKYILIFFVAALLLSACRIESNIILDINEDGSAVIGIEAGLDEAMHDLMTQAGGDPSEILNEMPQLGDGEMEETTRIEDGMTFYGTQTTIGDLSTYKFPETEEELFTDFSFEIDGSSATLAATIEAPGSDEFPTEGLGIDPSAAISDFFTANMIVTMPGTVTEHNADEVRADGSLVWRVAFTGSTEIYATSSFGGLAGVGVIWFVLAGFLFIGILAVTAAVVTSKRGSERAVEAAAAEHRSEI